MARASEVIGLNLSYNLLAYQNKNTGRMTVSVETVRMAKYRPSKNRSERSDLLQDYLAIKQLEVIKLYNISMNCTS